MSALTVACSAFSAARSKGAFFNKRVRERYRFTEKPNGDGETSAASGLSLRETLLAATRADDSEEPR